MAVLGGRAYIGLQLISVIRQVIIKPDRLAGTVGIRNTREALPCYPLCSRRLEGKALADDRTVSEGGRQANFQGRKMGEIGDFTGTITPIFLIGRAMPTGQYIR